MRLALATMVVGFVAGMLVPSGAESPGVETRPVQPRPLPAVSPPGPHVDQAALEADAVLAIAEEHARLEAVAVAAAAAAAVEAERAAARARAVSTPTPRASAVAGDWPTSLEPCGGDLPPCWVKNRESHGDYNAVSPGGAYRGAWQFAYGTWNGYGEYEYANEAPPEVQDARAREVWAGGAGCSAWHACG